MPTLPFGSLDIQEFIENWGRALRRVRRHVFERGRAPSAAGAAGGTEGLRVSLSADSLVCPTSDGASRFDSIDENENETTRWQGLRTVHCGANEAGARDLHSPSLRGFDGFQSPSCTMRRERWVSTSSIHEFDPGLGSTVLRVRLLGTRSTVRVHEPYPCLYPRSRERSRCPASPSPRPRRLPKLVLVLPSPTVVEKAGAAKSSPAAPIVLPVVP